MSDPGCEGLSRPKILGRGTLAGLLSGVACGVIVGLFMGLFGTMGSPEMAMTIAVIAAVVGAGCGVVIGLLGGLAFAALCAPLSRCSELRLRLVSAALVPVSVALWGVWVLSQGVDGSIRAVVVAVAIAVLGALAGAKAGPWVLRGKW